MEEDLGAAERGADTTGGRKQRRRQVVYDDSTGQTFVVRKHRRPSSDTWTDYSEDY